MSEFQKNPEIIIFAGPNGSGKSTFTQLLKPPMDYITPAVKCRRILRRINFHLQGGRMSCSECYND